MCCSNNFTKFVAIGTEVTESSITTYIPNTGPNFLNHQLARLNVLIGLMHILPWKRNSWTTPLEYTFIYLWRENRYWYGSHFSWPLFLLYKSDNLILLHANMRPHSAMIEYPIKVVIEQLNWYYYISLLVGRMEILIMKFREKW